MVSPVAAGRRRSISAAAAMAVVVVGLIVLAGWVLDVAALKALAPGLASMKANTAICLALVGSAVALVAVRPNHRRPAVAAAAVALAIGLATLVEYATGVNLGLDTLLFADPASSASPGRMSGATAIGITLTALAVLGIDDHRVPPAAWQSLGLMAVIVASIAIVGYAYGVSELYQFEAFSTIALHTALSLGVLGIVILLVRAETGLVGPAVSDGPGGVLIRGLLAATTLMPLGLGFVLLAGARADLYPPEFAVAMVAVSIVVVLQAVIFRVAGAVDRADRARTAALAELTREVAERRRTEAFLEHVMDGPPLGVLALDLDGRVVLANRFAGVVRGRQADDLEGQSYAALLGPGDSVAAAEAVRAAIAGRPTTLPELPIVRPDGSEAVLRVLFAPQLEDDRATGVVVLEEDITERRRLEAQLGQSQRLEAVGLLAGGIAHDFNNVLTAIAGYARLLEEDLAGQPERRHDAEEILKASDRATALVRQLLAFSRRLPLRPEVIDLNGIVADLQPMIERLIGDDITVVVEPTAGLAAVEADIAQIEQVIVNLAVNARDAMPTGGRLTIETANVELDDAYARGHTDVEPGLYVMLAVSDTGIGMDDATRAHIFEPFYTTKAVGEGTGLGLATVYGIVRQSGGHIWVYSEPGRGATFKVYLPRAAGAVAAAPVRPERMAMAAAERATILVAEDELAVRQLVEVILSRLGHTVLLAADGATAVALAREQPIDLLITDVVMPGLSGVELAAAVRELVPEIGVLFVSGYTAGVIERHGPIRPPDAFLEKPFTPAALAEAAARVLAGRSARV